MCKYCLVVFRVTFPWNQGRITPYIATGVVNWYELAPGVDASLNFPNDEGTPHLLELGGAKGSVPDFDASQSRRAPPPTPKPSAAAARKGLRGLPGERARRPHRRREAPASGCTGQAGGTIPDGIRRRSALEWAQAFIQPSTP